MANNLMAAGDSWTFATALGVLGLALSVLGIVASCRGHLGLDRSDIGFFLRTGAVCLLGLAVCIAMAVSW